MTTISLSTLIAVLALATILSFSETTGQWNLNDCCPSDHRTYHVCLGLPNERPIKIAKPSGDPDDVYWARNDRRDDFAQKCVSLFCADGSDADDKYCGVGRCGLFGCNCIGGCRKGNGTGHAPLRRAWLKKHGLVRETMHRF